MIAAIIPARGGSKGIPMKNIKPFLGVPLIAYTITQSLASDRIDETYVSTDDPDIAATSGEYGAAVIDRPKELAGDEATTESALVHAIEEMRDRGHDPDITVLLQCTSPLRRESDIDECVSLVADRDYDSALSCCLDHKFYWTVNPDDGATPLNYDPKTRKRRQDLESRYQENGSIYATETESLLTEGSRLGGKIGVHKMPKSLSFEIDTPEDLVIVESIAQAVEFYDDGLAE